MSIKKYFQKSLQILILSTPLFLAVTPAKALDAENAPSSLNQKQIAAIAAKFKVEDCALWRGGPGHENDNVPKVYSEHVEAILEFLDNLSINEAMRAIELYCSSKGFDSKAVAQ